MKRKNDLYYEQYNNSVKNNILFEKLKSDMDVLTDEYLNIAIEEYNKVKLLKK